MFASYELALNPEVQQTLYEEIANGVDSDRDLDYERIGSLPYLDAVIRETLRHHNILVKLMRTCNQECELGDTGVTVTEGLNVEISVDAIHHSDQYYPNAYHFEPNRFTTANSSLMTANTYLPFGDGPRICIGMRFALMEIKICLANIVKHYTLTRTNHTVCPPELAKNPLVKIPRSLIIDFKPR